MVFSRWGQTIREYLDDDRFRGNKRIRLIIYLAIGVVMYAILVGSILPPRYHLTIGQTSPVTIRSPITTVDTAATQAAKEAAEQKVPKQYEQSTQVETSAVNQVDTLFATAAQVVSNKSLSSAQKLDTLSSAAPKKVSQSTLQALLTQTPAQISTLQKDADRIVNDLLGAPFYQESMQQAGLLVDRQLLDNFDLDKTSQLIVRDVVVSVLKPNMVYQAAATERAKQQAAATVPDVMIHQGDLIVSKYGIITSSVLSKLQDVGLYAKHPNYSVAVGFAGFIALSVGLLAAYIERRPPGRRLDNLMLGILGLVSVLMSVLIVLTKWVASTVGSSSVAYVLPISLGAMLITVMMDSSLAVVASFYYSFLLGAALSFNYDFVFYGFVASLVGAYSVAKVTSRGTFMRAGFFVSLMNMGAVIVLHLLQTNRSEDFHSFSLHIGLGALNGIIAAILAMGVLPFFETAFGLLTPIRLLELSNPNNPLLRQVLMEAPGTYHHSLIVGNLAEAAAEIVGADPLLCRVGAYYHDVGKTKRPAFFVENQMTKENPHDKIAPSLSHLIITSHVSDGLEMQKRAGLPKPIQDICATHHGTTILWYFYNKAKELDKNGTVKVDDFRYPGPKPKTRECAILMICDAVEAAVRSMARPTPNRVEGVIRKIIRDRLQDGQLDECDLTLQDLDVMIGAFMKTLKGVYHSRIEYPDIDKLRKEVAK
ncbi:HD family phosphohydrolase [Alicyclobacillus acidoterrestris]|uniref:HDIG domain-containing protein n=1 Tax=Alicyclobacillus acidoterrestris (strain ATCC 49025 / DSM 3922 / CIP 106132 / NCIMB 13137 / GD3B) TaxID=1356854 RepID=T0C8V7_ALIAG|nr:HDIG domain-containing metalloprotein [Alicyclobacillus acidoterrestris]EPZ52593.1 7TM receptor with intracellular metal dependent phosphohydrolase [Alicyclobacillus acidoterrestris ATCC 49025]UNO47897.1 HDIG domain-containing protein [Alicyclobacillus acidoterrestris]GEO26833.1 HD family phosphohydrolase [Alicyclobacillus acidoterrestris]